MQTRLIVDPISTCNSPEPNMKASGTTTCRFTKCDIIPVAVETCKNQRRTKHVEQKKIKKKNKAKKHRKQRK